MNQIQIRFSSLALGILSGLAFTFLVVAPEARAVRTLSLNQTMREAGLAIYPGMLGSNQCYGDRKPLVCGPGTFSLRDSDGPQSARAHANFLEFIRGRSGFFDQYLPELDALDFGTSQTPELHVRVENHPGSTEPRMFLTMKVPLHFSLKEFEAWMQSPAFNAQVRQIQAKAKEARREGYSAVVIRPTGNPEFARQTQQVKDYDQIVADLNREIRETRQVLAARPTSPGNLPLHLSNLQIDLCEMEKRMGKRAANTACGTKASLDTKDLVVVTKDLNGGKNPGAKAAPGKTAKSGDPKVNPKAAKTKSADSKSPKASGAKPAPSDSVSGEAIEAKIAEALRGKYGNQGHAGDRAPAELAPGANVDPSAQKAEMSPEEIERKAKELAKQMTDPARGPGSSSGLQKETSEMPSGNSDSDSAKQLGTDEGANVEE